MGSTRSERRSREVLRFRPIDIALRISIIVGLTISVLLSHRAAAQTTVTRQVLTLHFSADTNGTWKLTAKSVAPGTIKNHRTPPATTPAIRVQLENAANLPLWRAIVEDPSWGRLAIDGPSASPPIRFVRRAVDDFVVQVPSTSEAKFISLFTVGKIEPQDDGTAIIRVMPQPKLLGRFPLTAAEEK